MSRNPRRLGTLGTVLVTLLILAIIGATGFVVFLCIDMTTSVPEQPTVQEQVVQLPTEAATEPAPTETTVPPTTAPPEPEHVVATATIASQGDLLMHKPVFDTCANGDGTYTFDSIFRYVKDYVSGYDYALANLETTFGGDKYKYQGNPAFNCPDGLELSVKDAGYDMLLTTNNHCGDTMADGVKRTIEVVRAAGLQTLGTQLNDEEPKHQIVEINGIKVGMVGYSWAFQYNGGSNTVSMNGLTAIPADGTINFFHNSNLDAFYKEVQAIHSWMKNEEGADVTMIQIHWGVEYNIEENATQNKIAQKLCDMGFDVIVGGHPHVVQPVELLTSTVDENHKTAVIYSLGNAVSNQRAGYSELFPGHYTEDGALFEVTFEKYSDGTVYLAGVDVLPTWVNMRTDISPKEYNIIPLDNSRRSEWGEAFGLNANTLGQAEKSYDRTMDIVGEGVEQCNTYLTQAKADREQYYYDLAHGLIEAPAEAAAEPVVETAAAPAETVAPAA